jgi:hypothetical protein
MEQEPNKKGLVNPEIEQKRKFQESYKKDLENDVEQGLESLKIFVDNLEFNRGYIKFQEESREEFSQKEIDDLKEEIKEEEDFIKGIRDSIDGLLLQKESVQEKIDELNKLEKRFRDELLKIKPENLQ